MISPPIGQYRSQLTGCWSLIGLISVLLSHITQMITAALLTDKRGLPQPLKYKHCSPALRLSRRDIMALVRNIPPSGTDCEMKSFLMILKKFWLREWWGGVCVQIGIVWTFFKIFKNRYPRSKTARDILDLEENNKNFCLQEYRSVVK